MPTSKELCNVYWMQLLERAALCRHRISPEHSKVLGTSPPGPSGCPPRSHRTVPAPFRQVRGGMGDRSVGGDLVREENARQPRRLAYGSTAPAQSDVSICRSETVFRTFKAAKATTNALRLGPATDTARGRKPCSRTGVLSALGRPFSYP